jgi:hypothetical protein
LTEAAGGTPQEIIAHLMGAATAWCNGQGPDDDLTFIVMKAADRLTRSVDYPFALFTHREDFQPAPLFVVAGAEDPGIFEYNPEESADLSIRAAEPHDPEAQLYVDILRGASATIESAKDA